MAGDVTNRFDRRRIIVFSRVVGGSGFALLALNMLTVWLGAMASQR